MANVFRSRPTFVANPPTADRQKTVVVLGAFRGGTSLVARILKNLGVFMGDEFAPSDREYETIEDAEFQQLLHRRDLLARAEIDAGDFTAGEIASLRALINRRDADHDLWGWKYPGSVVWYLHAGIERYLRNPHFVTVFRDPLAVFQHELDKDRMEPADARKRGGRSFEWVGLQYRRLIEHVAQSDAPHLLVSYERATTGGESAKAALVDALTEFLLPAADGARRTNGLLAFR
jgi:hypothetical protein